MDDAGGFFTAVGTICAAGVTIYELTWLGRSSLAWVLVALGLSVTLLGVGQFIALWGRAKAA